MDAEAWIMLVLIGPGILGSLAYFVIFVTKSALSSLPPRPVWMVLLNGGINGRDRYDDPDDEWSERRPAPPRPPSRSVHANQTGAKREVAT